MFGAFVVGLGVALIALEILWLMAVFGFAAWAGQISASLGFWGEPFRVSASVVSGAVGGIGVVALPFLMFAALSWAADHWPQRRS